MYFKKYIVESSGRVLYRSLVGDSWLIELYYVLSLLIYDSHSEHTENCMLMSHDW